MDNFTQRPHILVVEDHNVFRRFLLSWLSRSYEVTAVSNGFDALSWLQEGNQTDLVLLDMEMPRIDGPSFLRNIRCSGIHQHLPVVALTSRTEEEVASCCEGLDLEYVFRKPYRPEALLSAIGASLGHIGRLQAA